MGLVEAQHLKKKAAHHLRDERLIVTEIGYGPDRFRQDEKPVGIAQVRSLQQLLHHLHANDYAGEIVVHHGGMAEMCA